MELTVIIIQVLLLVSLSSCSSGVAPVYYVKTTPDAKCPGNPCFTLSEYAQNVSQYFTSNGTFDFLSGNHNLDRDITIFNVPSVSISFIGEQNNASQIMSWITCTEPAFFNFTRVNEITIDALGFISCGRGISLPRAFYFDFVDHFSIEHSVFERNLETTLLVSLSSGTMVNVSFTNNTASQYGGAMLLLNSSLIFSGVTTFSGNTAGVRGGAIYAEDSLIEFQDVVRFENNMAAVTVPYTLGGAIALGQYNTLHFRGSATFLNNSAFQGGAIGAFLNSNIYSNGNITFLENFAGAGGAIFITQNCTIELTGTNVFNNNIGAGAGGGAILSNIGHITFTGATVFHSNQAPLGLGGVLNVFFSTITIVGQSNFTANSAPNGGAIYSNRGDISFIGTGEFSDNNCSGTGGAMYLRGGSTTSFNGSFHFQKNRALQGGAISIEQDSFLGFVSPLQLVFTDNQAMCGGAIIVLDRLILTGQSVLSDDMNFCFFEVFGTFSDTGEETPDVYLTFTDNTAEVAGSVLYGGELQNCTIAFFNTPVQRNLSTSEAGIIYFWNISNITSHVITSEISSEPFRICFCQNNTYNCETEFPPFHKSPGQSFNFSVVAVDQITNPIPASIRAMFSVESTAELGTGEQTQNISRFCSRLQYKVFSSSMYEKLNLAAQNQCNELGKVLQSVVVVLLPCPNGFEPSGDRCICEKRLQQLSPTMSCDVETYSMERLNSLFWVNASYSSNGSYKGLITYPDCPFDYCQAGPVNFTLSDPNAQCAFNRSGFLCGGCESGFSLTIGSSQCAQCSNTYLVLLIAFVALGVALVLVISLCRLTVGMGTVNGLIFYANIVGINQTIFFPKGESNVLTV